LVARKVSRILSASRSEKPIGFSTSTGLPSCKALRIGSVCCCSGVETITAGACGGLITSSLLPLWASAPAPAAGAAARGGARPGGRGRDRDRRSGGTERRDAWRQVARATCRCARPRPRQCRYCLASFAPPKAARRSSLRHLPHRNVAPIAAHALLVDVDAEPG